MVVTVSPLSRTSCRRISAIVFPLLPMLLLLLFFNLLFQVVGERLLPLGGQVPQQLGQAVEQLLYPALIKIPFTLVCTHGLPSFVLMPRAFSSAAMSR